jgi:PGF-pre-PGF domain-containing protein
MQNTVKFFTLIIVFAFLISLLTITSATEMSDGNGNNSIFDKINTQVNLEFLLANFSSNVTNGYVPLTVQFTDLSTNATGWNWSFGDGNSSILRNPAHTYYLIGNYTVNLTVSNGNNTDSKAREIIVHKVINNNKTRLVANFTSNITSGYAPLSVQFTDTSQNATVRSWDFNNDGVGDSSDVSPIYTFTIPGTYTVKLIVNNTNGNTSKKSKITVLKESTSSSDGSSGSSHSFGSFSGGGSSGGDSSGGNAGGSPEPQSNVEAKEISQSVINSGNFVKFNFQKNATSVVYVGFKSKITNGKTTTIVEMLKRKSTLVSGLPSGKINNYLNIWVGNNGFATPNNIENAVICFKVEKSWVQDKMINQSSIILSWYNDKKWDSLPTSQSGEDDNYLYFTAQTSGFSQFAIIGNTIAKEVQTEVKTESGIKNNKVSKSEQTSEIGKSSNLIVFGMICMIALLLVAFLF